MSIFLEFNPTKDDIADGIIHSVIALITVIVVTALAAGEITNQLKLFAGISVSKLFVWIVAFAFYSLFVLLASSGLFVFWRGASIEMALYSVSAGIDGSSIEIKESWLLRRRTSIIQGNEVEKITTSGQCLQVIKTNGHCQTIKLYLLPEDVTRLAKSIQKEFKER